MNGGGHTGSGLEEEFPNAGDIGTILENCRKICTEINDMNSNSKNDPSEGQTQFGSGFKKRKHGPARILNIYSQISKKTDLETPREYDPHFLEKLTTEGEPKASPPKMKSKYQTQPQPHPNPDGKHRSEFHRNYYEKNFMKESHSRSKSNKRTPSHTMAKNLPKSFKNDYFNTGGHPQLTPTK